jgi:hypothetical protein
MKDINLINKKELCVLKLSKDKRNVYLEYIPIVPDKNISEKLKQFDLDYKSNSNSILFLIEFIEKNLSKLLDAFSYCISLKDSYQQLPANGHAYFVTRHSELIKQLSDIPPDKTDRIEIVKNDISDLRTKFHSYINRRFNAFNIAQAYKICENNTDILSFSHRRIGWTKPIYPLTPNFAFEIKTNFGYGHVSYFFTKLIYKGIEIIPFSEWVMYPHADFSEIIRYSKKHNLDDKDWYFALTYAKDACNLSLTNEQAFVDKYIMSECDKMINELESILNKNEFNYHLEHVKSDEKGFRIEPETQKIVLAGHELIEFRGEKISGALNFIEKILSFEKVRSMNAFIDRIKKLNLADHEWQQIHSKAAGLAELPIHWDDTPGLTLIELSAKAKRLKRLHGIEMIVIDYLQLITVHGKSRFDAVSDISRGLKILAKELTIPIIALSQLSRAVESRPGNNKRPMLSDLRESGSIEQDADMVCFLYRPEYYGLTEDEEGRSTAGMAEVIVAKHRNGSTDTVLMNFEGKTTNFTQWDEGGFGTSQDGVITDFSFLENKPSIQSTNLNAHANWNFGKDEMPDDSPF